MDPREARRTPFSLRRALLLLVPLALLGTALLGLLASSASADHQAVPTPAPLVGPAAPGNDSTPTWTFTRPVATSTTDETVFNGATTTVTIRHDYTTQCLYGPTPAADTDFTAGTATCGVAFSATGYAYDGAVSTDGPYVLSVRTLETTTTTTNDGSSAPATAPPAYAYSTAVSATYDYDGTAPTVTLVRETASPSNVRTPTWTYTVTGGNAAVCVLTGPDGVAVRGGTCAVDRYTAPSLSVSGPYTLSVSSTDAASNRTTQMSTYALDITPPVVSISGPTSGTAQTVTWKVAMTGATSATCTLSTGASFTCNDGSTVQADVLTDGSVTLTVVAADGLGNSTTEKATYTRSTTPSAPTVTAQTPSPSTDTTAAWTFTVDTLTTAAQCRLERGTVVVSDADCGALDKGTGPYVFSATLVGDGVYTLFVTASNSTSPTTATGSASYTLDTFATAGPTLTPAQPGSTGSASPLSWTWTPDAGHTTDCRLTINAGTPTAWADCAGSFSVTPGAQGTYLLEVRQVDSLGNTGTPSSASYLYDSIAPVSPSVTLVGTSPRQPGLTTWNVTAATDVVRTECRVLAPVRSQQTWPGRPAPGRSSGRCPATAPTCSRCGSSTRLATSPMS